MSREAGLVGDGVGAVSQPGGRGRVRDNTRDESGAGRPERPVRELRLSDHLLRDAASLTSEESVLEVERWVSGWLGRAWLAAGIGEREPERQLCLEVIGRASNRPSPHGLAAVAALLRVAAPSEVPMLDVTVEILSAGQPLPPWSGMAASEPVASWRAVDVWDSEHVLFVEYGGPVPHTLMVQIMLAGGVLVEKLALLKPGAAASWERLRESGQVPMPIVECPSGVRPGTDADRRVSGRRHAGRAGSRPADHRHDPASPGRRGLR